MNKLIIISGPTAVGKTRVALELAKKFNGELISADSRQVYKGMDVVTGKDLGNAQFSITNSQLQQGVSRKVKKPITVGTYTIERVPVWGLDLIEPDEAFDVSTFIPFAKELTKDIWRRRKLPIIVGGTGFYIKGLLNPYETVGIPVIANLRKELEKLPVRELQQRLKEINFQKWEQMNVSDRSNPRRLVRAIEVGEYKKVQSAKCQKQVAEKLYTSYLALRTVLWIGLIMEKGQLKQKIAQRVEERVNQGAVEEIKTLLNKGYGWDLPSMSAIGYRDLRPYLENKKTLEEAVEDWKLHEIQYAKRQLTWNKKEKQIVWFDVASKNWDNQLKLRVQKWLKTS